jgi:hypothetical protein
MSCSLASVAGFSGAYLAVNEPRPTLRIRERAFG